jgi:RNA polymerase sigma-70 factor, ECF subfamily
LVSALIIQACINNDSRCQRLLYDECFSFMMQIATRYTINIDDAKDIVNKSFLKVLQNLQNLQSEDAYWGWCKRITVNTALDEVKAAKRLQQKVTFTDEPKENTNSTIINNGQQQMEAAAILQLIADLPIPAKHVVNLVIIDGYTHKEVATMLGITEENSRRLLHTGRNLLKEQINQLNGNSRNATPNNI